MTCGARACLVRAISAVSLRRREGAADLANAPRCHRSGVKDRLWFLAPIRKFASLFAFDSLNRILNESPFPHPNVKLNKNGRALRSSTPHELVGHIRNGATLVLENAERYDGRLAVFLDRLSSELCFATRANVYFSQPRQQGYQRRLRPEDAASLLQHVASGRVYVPAYRGSMLYSGVLQLAEAVGQAERSAGRPNATVTVGTVVEHSDSRADVEVKIGAALRLLVRCVRRQYEVTIDCRQLDAGRTRQVRRWTVERVERLPK